MFGAVIKPARKNREPAPPALPGPNTCHGRTLAARAAGGRAVGQENGFALEVFRVGQHILSRNAAAHEFLFDEYDCFRRHALPEGRDTIQQSHGFRVGNIGFDSFEVKKHGALRRPGTSSFMVDERRRFGNQAPLGSVSKVVRGDSVCEAPKGQL